ncbi:nucleolar protein 12 [Cordyceps fumosorosea ARSEF 2679]|uniref:Nucleolar protein 12 n=1 Tax=Cordyceps fumosorosea (strain ARSEF 2679) TaxID=1081104 RepID=A0A162JE05_CORFA|nr:nucleolar protein 12 [Cordyceps fumosorosea ARSEF 2679]OAA67562.1 nucleolar protein 12 [Cordyceps fumosorosea ARSEF 2679]
MGKKNSLLASSKAVDPHLEALFASSSGPVSAPPTSRYQKLRESKPKSASNNEASDDDDEVLSEASEELDYEDDEENDKDGDEEENSGESEEEEEGEPSAKEESKEATVPRQERKRKRKDDNEDLEGKYLASLSKNDKDEPSGKRVKGETTKDGSGSDSDNSDDSEEDEKADNEVLPTHESLSKEATTAEADKASRTVFLANVSSEAVSSKSAKKQLLAHLSAALDNDDYPLQKVESIRFRSIAFSALSMPKRAAYITKSVMEATTHSANAYVVFSTAAAARRVCQQLNGSEVLGRHLRVDSVAHPSKTDHRRCVFVGNLGYFDDENTDKDGEKETKKRNKVPADVEEGLWRTFSKHGKVENVRVVRDPQTRAGKGFAYVQFYDANAVEEALLLDGKSFPPMLPRKLRVTRAKDPRKTNQAMERTKAKFNSGKQAGDRGKAAGGVARKGASTYVPKLTPDQQAAAGRAGKLFGRARANGGSGAVLPSGVKAPEKIVFEGRRASSRDALPKDLKKKVKSKRARPTTRSARRGADWKKKSSDK